MPPSWNPEDLLCGPEAQRLPVIGCARWCDLRPRFIFKCRAGRGYRAIARNGRVLLVSELPLDQMAGQVAHVRLQTWHRRILPDDLPEPYGLLLCVNATPQLADQKIYNARFVKQCASPAVLGIDVGGGLSLAFFPAPSMYPARGAD